MREGAERGEVHLGFETMRPAQNRREARIFLPSLPQIGIGSQLFKDNPTGAGTAHGFLI